jgi:N6-adenosine-specific RNA methylase IME4
MRPTKYLADTERTEARVQYNHRYYAKRHAQRVYQPLPAGPYRVIYADPPWKYYNRDPTYHGHASDRFPPLSIAEICALPVRRIVEKSAVLFLWVTAPLLFECTPILKAWGFAYKTNIVWDKDTYQYGYYVSGEHEHLLIATRGSCKPDVGERYPSVMTIKPTALFAEKPKDFRGLIDTLYPRGRRIELFARVHPDGWDVWGNQVPLVRTA